MNFSAFAPRRAALAFTLGLATLLASCGGGDPVKAFEPRRVLAFGDEYSVITPAGRKYGINAMVADSGGVKTLSCVTNPLWVQRLAASHGLVFPECNPDNVADPASRIYAAEGATVADLAAQIDQHLAADSFSDRDLVTLLVGQHDLLALYASYPATPSAELVAAAKAAGGALAAQVVRVADAGGKVLVSTVPSLSVMPFARADDVTAGDNSRTKLLKEMVDAFNGGLRLGIAKENGSEVALMLTNELMDTMYKYPSSYAMSNSLVVACDAALAPALIDCSTDTLVTGATSTSHLWADDRHFGPQGHAYIGTLAANRVRTNPF
ncbi:esterase [Piscinibacter sp.]|uniref:esterase n=1 Tax=Piscinibacter sp. TaxID=1903157 RepID=UPI0039E6246F